ncbi:MAG TPA: hypothetical protein VEK33_00365 [Terriglobales bacterium]|nr:hypothetical protein [Terriglobales bacterium]
MSFTVRRHRHGSEADGYVLLTLILFVALLAIAMTVLAPAVVHQMKRDREEELIHRGVQYSRAIKHYVKKFGRYPTKIEDLQNTNNIHFLRKVYKDPVTGKDFKILRMGDVQMSFGPGLAGATSAANLASQSGAFGNGNSLFARSGFGGLGGNTFGGNTFGANSFGGGTFGSNGTPAPQASPSPQASGQQDSGANPDQSLTPGAPAGPTSTPSGQATTNSDNKVFGGGPMIGVASVSKEKTIRIFNKKDHYYQWQFIYDQSMDRGGLITTPNQGLQSFAGGVQPGTPGNQGGQPNSPFGAQGSQFGFQGGSPMSPGMQPMQPAQSQPSQQPLQQPQFPPDQAPQ